MSATCYDSRPGDTDRWPLRPLTPIAGGDSVFGSFWQPAPRATVTRVR